MVDNDKVTKQEKLELLRDAINMLDKISPFSRISVPQHLLDRWNVEIGNKSGRILTELAFTVAKGTVLSEEELWELMTKTYEVTPIRFGDSKSNPPDTGMSKISLQDI